MRSRIYSLVLIAAVASVLAAGCGGGGDAPKANANPGNGGSSGSSGSSSSITISNFKFSPSTLKVKAGAQVKVSNKDSTEHTITADNGHSFDSNVDASGSTTVKAPAAGTYAYHCSIHPFMHGKLVVQ
jgi:plastocyanin